MFMHTPAATPLNPAYGTHDPATSGAERAQEHPGVAATAAETTGVFMYNGELWADIQ